MNFIEAMNKETIALVPELANEQHYEVPSKFYDYCLGKHKKYSSCYWTDKTKNLNQSESEALALTANHAQLKDGQSILELGCGWGSLTLWMAQNIQKVKLRLFLTLNLKRYIYYLRQKKGS